MKKKRIKNVIYGLAIFAVSIGGGYGYSEFINYKSSVGVNTSKIVTAKKVNMDVCIKGTGSSYASVSEDIFPNNNGKIKDLNVKLGDVVQNGTKLFTSYSEELTKNMNDAQINLDKQKAIRDNDIKIYNDELMKAKEAISESKKVLDNANNDFNKMIVKSPVDGVVVEVKSKNGESVKGSINSNTYSNLEKDNEATVILVVESKNPDKKIEITPSYDGILNNFNLKVGDSIHLGENLFDTADSKLKQNVQKAQDNLEKQNSALEELKSCKKLEFDKLNISDAEIVMNSATSAVNKMNITASINGIVTGVNNKNEDGVLGINTAKASNGSSKQTMKPVITIVDPASMKVKVAVDELDIGKIKEGQKAEIEFDAINSKTYEGTVESISETGITINGVTNYNVIVSIQNPEDVLIGMSGNVSIAVDSKTDVLAVPVETIVEKDNEKYVRNANNNLIEVKTGIQNENYIEILDGIEEGEELLSAYS